MNLAFAPRRQVREKRRPGNAARARAPDVDVSAAGDLAHRIDGLLQRRDIAVDPEVALGRRGVLPADGEGLQAAVDAMLNDAFLGYQIEDIEFVDLRRGDQQ